MSLALICGGGDLPAAVAEALPERPLVCALEGFEPQELKPDLTFRIESLGTLLSTLSARGVSEVCLVGHITRPRVDLGALDDATLPLVPRLRDALARGDDGALRVVLALFSEYGFVIRAAHEAAPALLPPAGVPTARAPGNDVAAEARLGDAALAEMARADLGQACVIRQGLVIAREDAAGTDALLRVAAAGPDGAADPVSRLFDDVGSLLGSAADWLSGQEGGTGFLFKAPKPGQDRRADLPVIGPRTVEGAAQAGLQGIVIEAGGVMVLHRARTIRALDRAGLFLWVRERPEP